MRGFASIVAVAGAVLAVTPPVPATAGGGPRGLPVPVVFETQRAARTLLPSGSIVVTRPERPRCEGTTSMLVAGDGACLEQRTGGFAVLRNDREVWRSTAQYRLNGVFAKLGPRAVAFSYERYDLRRPTTTLLLAPLGGRERAIARNERPLGWTRGGELLTWRFHHGGIDVYLRAADGKLLRRVATRLAEIRFDPATRSLLVLSRTGAISRTDGRRREWLADVERLGFPVRPSIELLAGGLVGVLGRSRVAVLRHDGSLFASAELRARGKQLSVAGNSGLVANEAGTAVAFTVTEGNDGYRSVGRESVYVLRAGDRHAAPAYARQLRFALCERWAGLSWHGDWLLYATTEGRTVAIDATRAGPRVDLTAITLRVGGRSRADGKANASVRWET